eukprot:399063_1
MSANQQTNIWSWNSINSIVNNTKTASESFFDNVTATLTKKNEQNEQTAPQNEQKRESQSSSLPQENDSKQHQSSIEEWKSNYNQLKNAHVLKTAMLQNELQKYKDNEHNSIQNE